MSMYKRANFDGADLDYMGDIQADLCDQSVSEAVNLFSSQSDTSSQITSGGGTINSRVQILSPEAVSKTSPYTSLTPSARATMNAELDSKFITFLVYHITNAIAAEISLELCLVNYIMRKEVLNGVSSREKQIITNWKDIFVSIETLIITKINRDSNTKRNIIETACMGSINKYTLERESSMNSLSEQRETMPDIEYKTAIGSVDENYDRQIDKVKAALKGLVGEIDKAEISVLRKVVRTLFNVARKVCYMWAQFNDCLSLLTAEEREKYAKIYAAKDNLQKNLKFAEENRLLYMQSETENSNTNNSITDVNELSAGSCNSQMGDDEVENRILIQQARKVLVEKNHVQELEQMIRGIKVDTEQMKDLVTNVMWVKMPRNCTSIAKALSPDKSKGVKSGGKDDTVDPTIEPPSAASVANMADFLKSGGKPPAIAALAPNDTVTVVDQETIDAEQMEFAKTYDGVIRLLMMQLRASCDTLCIHLHHKFKSGKTDLVLRLRFLQFLVSHRDLPPQEIGILFSDSQFYDLFTCVMFTKAVRANTTNIRSDGYCFYRSIYQLYLRELSQYERTVDIMAVDDKLCNTTDHKGESHSSFLDFMADFSSHIKPENSKIKKMFPVKHFKLVANQRVLPKLLKKKPGLALPLPLWGNQADVYMLKFNVTGWELIDENQNSALHLAENDCQWMRYKNCSADSTFDALKLPLVDRLCSIVPNFVCFKDNHFFVVESPSVQDFAESISDVKIKLMERIMDGVSLVPEPDLFLERLEDIIQALENGAYPSYLIKDPLDFAQFSTAYGAKYPLKEAGPSIDLSKSPTERERSTEVDDLKEELRISREKVIILFFCSFILLHLTSTGCYPGVPCQGFGRAH